MSHVSYFSDLHYQSYHPTDNRNNNYLLSNPHRGYHEQRLMEMRQETEYYRQQLELENIRQELRTLRGSPNKPVLPSIVGATSHFGNDQMHIMYHQQQHQMMGQRQNEV